MSNNALTREQHAKELEQMNRQIYYYTEEIEKLQKAGDLSPEDKCLISTLEHARDAIATNRMVLNNRKRK
jgi:prefoldin subunit 5